MIKLIVGIKGTGKTKQLIDMANAAVTATKGCVICVEKGNKLIHEIKYQARLVDVDEYAIDDARSLYGFVSGMFASNHDINEFIEFIKKLDKFTAEHQMNIVVTSSIPIEELPAELEKYTK